MTRILVDTSPPPKLSDVMRLCEVNVRRVLLPPMHGEEAKKEYTEHIIVGKTADGNESWNRGCGQSDEQALQWAAYLALDSAMIADLEIVEE